MNRRDFLRASGSAALAAVGCAAPSREAAVSAPRAPQAKATNPKPTRPRPRAFVQIFLAGGLDATLTTDPKIRRQVDPRVDLPYSESDIVEVGRVRLGPLFAPLASRVPQMVLINGLDCSTVAHQVGMVQVQQMRRQYASARDAGLTGTLGTAVGHDCPVDDVRLKLSFVSDYWLPPAGRSLVLQHGEIGKAKGTLELMSRLARDDLRRNVVADALRVQSGQCTGTESCTAFDVARGFLERMPHEPLPSPFELPRRPLASDVARFKPQIDMSLVAWETVLRDALFLLKHRLTPTIFIWAPTLSSGWDTHQSNLAGQRAAVETLLSPLTTFLDELERTPAKDGGMLSDETGVLITSELGRFPFLNEYRGKDHFPEFPAILLGPGLRPGQYGETDSLLRSAPISMQTGHASSSPRDVVPTIDDLGASVLHWFGVDDPASLAYRGRRLDFMLA